MTYQTVGKAVLAAAAITAVASIALAHGPKHNPVRHEHFMKNGLPAAYAGKANPLQNNSENTRAGQALFAENCASCHGTAGKGGGEAGADLDPKPPELQSMIGMPMADDGYLMWAVAEGGEALSTDMPAFKDSLSEKELWQIVQYMQNGFAGK